MTKKTNFAGVCTSGVVGAVLSLVAMCAQAADIQSVAGALRDGREVVQINLTDAIDFDPVAFSVQSPARISLDFPGVGTVEGRKTVEVNQGNLRAINVVEAGDRSRVILNLRESTTYQIQRDGKAVYVYLDSGSAQSPSQPAPGLSGRIAQTNDRSAVQVDATRVLRDLDFRRTEDGGGRVVVDLPNNRTNVDMRQEGKKIVLDLPGVILPAELRRRLDVTDFGTPVQFVTARESAGSTRVEIEAPGDWTHSSYQSDGQFVVELRAVKQDPSKLTQGPGFNGEKLSLNFQNIEIRALLQVIADFTKFNIVTSDTVQGSLTLRLEDVPWDQALQIILDSKGLGFEKSGNVLWVAPKDELDARKQREYEAKMALQKLEPLRTQKFQLNYIKAEDILDQLLEGKSGGGGGSGSGQNNRFLSERGSAISEKRTNQLFVTDTPSKLEELTTMIAAWDVPTRQVLIEARIVEANDSFGRNLGVRLGGGYTRSGSAIGATSSSSGNFVNSGSFVNLPAAGLGSSSAGTFAVSIFNNNANRFLNLELTALEAVGNGRVVSSPRIVTADQTEAVIEQGTEYPYAVTAPNGATTVEFKKAVLKLEVTPQITPEGNVILDLVVHKDSRGEVFNGAVSINTKNVTTQVLVENGGTVVIGGIFELEENVSESKIPLLGDIPALGNLFKSRMRSSEKRELLVFITPKIVTDQNSLR